MSNTETAASATETAKRAKQATHEYIDAQGNKVGPEQAVGYRFISERGFTHEDFPMGKDATPGTKVLMLALFGDKTLHINTASQARQNDEDEQEAITERWAMLDQTPAVWRERGEGATRGPKYDRNLLAQAVYDTASDEGKAKADSLGGVPYLANKLAEDKSYAAKVRARNVVMARYYELAQTDDDSDSLIA